MVAFVDLSRKVLVASVVIFLVLLFEIESSTLSTGGKRDLEQQLTGIRTEKDADYWLEKASNALKGQLEKRQLTNRAKNIILFIGDGMSMTTVTAARIYGGQLHGNSGESSSLSFEHFPYLGLAKTYCVNSQVADSACSATAYLSGVKNNRATIGVTANVTKYDCNAERDNRNHLSSILDWAQQANMSTGIVTNTRITHATPAGSYAHSSYRHWESDRDIAESKKIAVQKTSCRDIAQQLIRDLPGKNINVILGGGREKLQTSSQAAGKGRLDGTDLVEEWIKEKQERGLRSKFVSTRNQLLENNNDIDYLLGLFSDSHFQYKLLSEEESQPSLAEMTEAAIKVLSKNENGYFLFIEGGLIDLAHHANKAHVALHETIEFDSAIKKAVSLTNESETLIVVTADHSHTLTHSGYPVRGSSMFGLAGISNVDRMPLPVLSYASGPGYHHAFSRNGYRYPFWNDQIVLNSEVPVPAEVLALAAEVRPRTLLRVYNDVLHQRVYPDIWKRARFVLIPKGQRGAFQSSCLLDTDKNFRFPATFPQHEANHGGEDVPVYASGPWSHLLSGSYEQNLIPIVMAFASRIGPSWNVNKTNSETSTLNKSF